MDVSGSPLVVVRRAFETPIAGEHARQYVEIARAAGFADPGEYSPHAERVLRAELLAWPRVWRGAVTLAGTLLGGLGLGLGLALSIDMPIVGVLLALLGLHLGVPAAVWGVRVVRDGREVKRAFRAWSAAGDRVQGQEYPVGFLHTRRPFSTRGVGQAVLMGLLAPGMFASWSLPFYAAWGDEPAIERLGLSVAAMVATIAVTYTVSALWRTPWQMFYRAQR